MIDILSPSPWGCLESLTPSDRLHVIYKAMHQANGETGSVINTARRARDYQAELAEANANLEKLSLDRLAEFGSADAIHAIREILNHHEVPLAAFIDDHVGNAIVQRNQAREERDAAHARIAELEAALEPFSGLAGLEEARYENCIPPDTLLVASFMRDLRRARAALRNR